jgi:hypothetical protein
MHALSIMYYEVVQTYRVETRATKCERCLFIPTKILNHFDVTLVDRYKAIPEKAAL